jgi:peptide/nickel transport system permease protein
MGTPLTANSVLVEAPPLAERSRSKVGAVWKTFLSSRYGPIGLTLLLIVLIPAILAPLLAPADPFDLGAKPFLHPGADGHPLGTDHLGRDVLSQILYGARISLLVGLVAAGIAAVIGLVVGSVSGFFGGWIDIVLSRVTDMFLIIPTFFLIIIVVATLGNGIIYVMVLIGLTSWPGNARLMRAQALTLRERTFVQALNALGEGKLRILMRHIIPNGIQPVIANSTLLIAAGVLTEAALSFLGLGDANKASWGRMIYEGRTSILTAWWPSIFPGIAMIITVMAFYLIGDGLAYVLSPKSRRAGG